MAKTPVLALVLAPYWLQLALRLHSYRHEYESGTVRVPVYEFRQTRVCVYYNGGRSHTYEYGLPVNFTRTSTFCAGHVFIQLMRSKLPVNNNNIMYKSCGAYLMSELTSLYNCSSLEVLGLAKLLAM